MWCRIRLFHVESSASVGGPVEAAVDIEAETLRLIGVRRNRAHNMDGVLADASLLN
jgi:hypothetical protein